mgnify:CR=1 FL=1
MDKHWQLLQPSFAAKSLPTSFFWPPYMQKLVLGVSKLVFGLVVSGGRSVMHEDIKKLKITSSSIFIGVRSLSGVSLYLKLNIANMAAGSSHLSC